MIVDGDRTIQKPEIITLSPSEHAFYSSGICKGHCEVLRQIAGQLRAAAAHYRQLVTTAMEAIDPDNKKIDLEALEIETALAGYDAIAEQLDEPAKKACNESQQHLAKAIVLRSDRRSLTSRIEGAVRGALGGWRGE